MNVSPASSQRLVAKLSDPGLAVALSHFVRARVPEAAVEDIVQSTLTEALDADEHPEGDEDIVRWVYGICRHKVVDWFRKARREVPRDLESPEDGPVAAAESAPESALDLLRWAKKELPAGEENEKTLEWMLREGEGEKLETIAAEANVPAPRVRQRVSRLRRYYKARWAAQAAAFAALLLIAIAVALALRQKKEEVAPAPGPSFAPSIAPPPQPTAPESLPQERPATSTPVPEPLEALPTSAPSGSVTIPPKPRATNASVPVPTSSFPLPSMSGAVPAPTGSGMPAVKPVGKKPSKVSLPPSESVDPK